MKKFMYIMLAFLAGLAYISCEEKQEEQISITLTAPPAGDLFNLAEVDRVNFDWTSQGVMESSSYKWLLSDNANLSDAVEKVVSGSSFEVQKAELEEIMAQLGFLPEENPKEHTFYWSIAAGDVKAEARPIKLKRKALPLIPNIYLTAPANNASFDLRSHTADVEFNWIAAPAGVFTGKTFNLLLSTSGTNFSSAATVVKQYIVASPAIVTVTELDQWAAGAGVAKGDEIDLYWTLQANGTFDEAPTTYIRKLTVTRPAMPVITLTAPANNAEFDLSTHTADVEFRWTATPAGDFTGKTFKLLISISESNFLSAATVVAPNVTISPVAVTVAELDQWAANAETAKGASKDFYWSIVPSDNTEASTYIHKFTVKRAAIFTDDFNQSAIGADWVSTPPAAFQITGNQYLSALQTGITRYQAGGAVMTAGGGRSFKLSVDVKIKTNVGSCFAGLIFNAQDANSWYLFRMTGGGLVQFLHTSDGGGGWDGLYETGGTYSASTNDYHRVEISSDTPGTFNVKITNTNNNVVFDQTLSGGSFNGGSAGLYSLDGQADFDNFFLELK